jgi:hypothetical protein
MRMRDSVQTRPCGRGTKIVCATGPGVTTTGETRRDLAESVAHFWRSKVYDPSRSWRLNVIRVRQQDKSLEAFQRKRPSRNRRPMRLHRLGGWHASVSRPGSSTGAARSSSAENSLNPFASVVEQVRWINSRRAVGVIVDTFHMRAVLSSEAVTTCVPSAPNTALLTLSLCPRSTAISLAVPASHSRDVLSLEAVTMRVPSGLNAALRTTSSCPRRIASSRPLPASHNLAVLSRAAVTTRFPSGLNAALVTAPSCPFRTTNLRPVTASHISAVSSSALVTIWSPSRLKLALLRFPCCGCSTIDTRAVFASHTRAVPSVDAVTMRFPSARCSVRATSILLSCVHMRSAIASTPISSPE